MNTIVDLDINSLVPDKDQPRKTFDDEAINLLKDSVEEHGIKIPLFVRPVKNNKYIILDGERRFRAATLAGLKQLPCIVETEDSEVFVLEKQLLLDCAKEKLSSVERDTAIYKYWKMLQMLPEEELKKRKPIETKSKDWTISYISRNIGISPYVVRVAIDKEDFKTRNENFNKKMAEKIEKSSEPQVKEKRYNIALEETARIKEIRENDRQRKKVVEDFVVSTKPKGQNDVNAHTLRQSLMSITQNTKQTAEQKELESKNEIFNGYIEDLNTATNNFFNNLKKHKIENLTSTQTNLLKESFISILSIVTDKDFVIKEAK